MTDVINSREQVFDQKTGQWKPRSIPTVSVKKIVRLATVDTGVTMSSVIPTNGTSSHVLTYLHINPGNLHETEFTLADRDGTFDSFVCGTVSASDRMHKPVILVGDLEHPIHHVNGTFSVYNSGGSQGDGLGTFIIAYELVKV